MKTPHQTLEDQAIEIAELRDELRQWREVGQTICLAYQRRQLISYLGREQCPVGQVWALLNLPGPEPVPTKTENKPEYHANIPKM